MKSFTATKNDDGVRLSRFCEKICPAMPKSMLYKSFRNKRIKVNGKKQDADYRINCGDLIELYINDEFFAEATEKNELAKKEYKNQLDIVFEDENLLLVYKPQGLLCHSDNKNEQTLISHTGGCSMKKVLRKIQFIATIIADDITLLVSMYFRRSEPETI